MTRETEREFMESEIRLEKSMSQAGAALMFLVAMMFIGILIRILF